MNNCLTCKKISFDKLENAACKTEDDKTHLVLERSLYDSKGDFRKALSECGVGCGKWEAQVKSKLDNAKDTSAVSSPKVAASASAFREKAGWVFGGCCLAINIVVVLALLGAF